MNVASILTLVFQLIGGLFVFFMIVGFFALMKENKEKEKEQVKKPVLDLKKATAQNQVKVNESSNETKTTQKKPVNKETNNDQLIDQKLINLLSKPVPKRNERENLEKKNSEMLIKNINNKFVLAYVIPKTNEDFNHLANFSNSNNFGFDLVVKLKSTAPMITVKHSPNEQNLISIEGLTIGQVETYLDDYLIEQYGLIA